MPLDYAREGATLRERIFVELLGKEAADGVTSDEEIEQIARSSCRYADIFRDVIAEHRG